MFYGFLLGVAALGGVIYFFASGLFPGLREERFGVLEPLPPNLGQWSADTESEAGRAAATAGEKLEVRLLFEEGGLLGAGRVLRQARVRDASTGRILRVLPDEVVKRRRIRQRV